MTGYIWHIMYVSLLHLVYVSCTLLRLMIGWKMRVNPRFTRNFNPTPLFWEKVI